MFKQRQYSSPYTSGLGEKALGYEIAGLTLFLGYSLRYPFLGWGVDKASEGGAQEHRGQRPLERRPQQQSCAGVLEALAQVSHELRRQTGPGGGAGGPRRRAG